MYNMKTQTRNIIIISIFVILVLITISLIIMQEYEHPCLKYKNIEVENKPYWDGYNWVPRTGTSIIKVCIQRG